MKKTVIHHKDKLRLIHDEFKRTGTVATQGFQASWLKNPHGTPGLKWPLVKCGKTCPISIGCLGCPVMALIQLGMAGNVKFLTENLLRPTTLKKGKMIWCCPEGDLFHKSISDEAIYQAFAVMESCPQHRFIVLTKRAARMEALLSNPKFPLLVHDVGTTLPGLKYLDRGNLWGNNIVAGVSIENQDYMWRSEVLTSLPKTVTTAIFAAPMLSSIQLLKHALPGWVVCCGERGSKWLDKPRPCDKRWMRDLKDQCVEANIPIHVLRRYDANFIDYMGRKKWLQFPSMLMS